MDVHESLWTARDVAAFLKTSTKWVYHHASTGTLPCVHVAGFRRFEPGAIRAWVEAHRAPERAAARGASLGS
jgi:predicted DNA-binding transcriptional regulator AlpA